MMFSGGKLVPLKLKLEGISDYERNLRVLLALEKKNQTCPLFFSEKEQRFLQPTRIGLV